MRSRTTYVILDDKGFVCWENIPNLDEAEERLLFVRDKRKVLGDLVKEDVGIYERTVTVTDTLVHK